MKKLIFLSAALVANIAGVIAQPCSELFISEYVEGSRNNKALEIYNPTSSSINLSSYRVTRWQNGGTANTAQWSDALSGTLNSKDVIVLVLDRRDTTQVGQDTPVVLSLRMKADLFLSADYNTSFAMSFNGDDALSLDKNTGSWSPVDIFGKIGERPTNATGGTSSPTGGWTDASPFNNGQGHFWTTARTLYRKATIQEGVKTNPSQFNPTIQWDTLPINSFDGLGYHYCSCDSTGRVGFTGYFSQSTFNTFDSTLLIRVMANKSMTVDAVVKGGSAVQGTDYDFSSKTISLNGVVLSYFKVKLLNNNFNGTRTLELALRNPSTGTVTQDSVYTVNIMGTGTISVQEIKKAPSFVLYPNPAENGQRISISASAAISELTVFDATGKVVRSYRNLNGDYVSFPAGDLPEGIYFTKIRFSDGQQASTKFQIR